MTEFTLDQLGSRELAAFDVTTGEVVRGPAGEPVGSYPVRLEGDALRVEV